MEVAKAANRPIAASYTGTAALEPLAESQVVAKTSGVALAVLVQEGQQVKAGQPLVRLDPDRARLTVAHTIPSCASWRTTTAAPSSWSPSS